MLSPYWMPVIEPVNAGLDCPYSRDASAGVTLNAAFWTLNERSTFGAGVYCPLPACEARTVIVPAPRIVTVLPDTPAGPASTLKLTVRPDEALALSANGGSP